MKKKVVPKLRQEVKMKVDIVTGDDIKIYYSWKFQDLTARYTIKYIILSRIGHVINLYIVFYHYEIDLNTIFFKTLLMGVYFCFHQNLSNYYNATKLLT